MPASLAFDWLMAVVGALLMAGVIQDGWAHNHGFVDQSFFTPWHAILYGMMGLNGLVLGITALRNRLRGVPLGAVLPRAYRMSLIGVIVFAIGGVLDLLWHTRFGVENDINALISPTHLWLAIGGAMVFAAPLVSIASRYDAGQGGWKIAGPALLSGLSMMTLLGFFTSYAQPIGDEAVAAILGRHAAADSGGALYSLNPKGTAEERVLRVAGSDIWGAAVSPDGKRVAYRLGQMQSAASDIWVAWADGSHALALTNSGRHDTQPAWSPDGSRIAYVSIPAGTSGEFELNVLDVRNRKISSILRSTTTMQFPAWSPDGKSIAFQSRNGLHQQIAIVPSRGGSIRWLAATAGGEQPAWWPGNSIAFADENGISQTNAAGTSARRLISGAAQMPAWSASGKIAFVRQPGYSSEMQIYVASANGSTPVDVTQLSGLNASHPSWSPRGEIFFTATGRPAVAETGIGKAYTEDANIIQAAILCGILLLLVRRWKLPFGAVTLVLGLFALAMATQSDLYYTIPGALAIGLATDAAISLWRDRIRAGLGFYALAFLLPFAFFTAYLLAVSIRWHGLGWPPNMIFGSPVIAGFVGLLVAFCYEAPLSAGKQSRAL